MFEVFKTNVTNSRQANILLFEILAAFPTYKANFDLNDCDYILRIACKFRPVEVNSIICLLEEFGFNAEILADEIANETYLMSKQNKISNIIFKI